MHFFLLLLTGLQQSPVKQNQCAYRPDNNSTMPAPIFYRRSYSFNVTAGMSDLGEVSAYSPWNSELWYSLVGTDDVTIDRRSGALRVVSFLRRDVLATRPQTFFAVATDSHLKSATIAVNVYGQSSDSARGLSFLSVSSTTTVYDDIGRGAYVSSIRATARDPSQQNQVRYYLYGSSSLRIDQQTGDIYVNRLPLYLTTRVNVTAVLGNLRIRTTLLVNKVCHRNVPVVSCFADPCQTSQACPAYTCVANYCGGCNAEYFYQGNRVSCSGPSTETPPRDRPVFNQSYYKLELSPSTPVNYNFIRVLATGDLSRTIVYSIQNTSDFSVNASNGWLFVTRKLTNNKVHTFTVTAAYRSSPTLTSTVNVYINITDKDSPSPSLFLRSSNAQVYSDIAPGGYVTTILAVSSDPSLQNQVRYYMSGSDSLRIDEFTGNVYVKRLPLNDRTSVAVTASLGSKRISSSLFVNKVCHPNVPVAQCFADPCQTSRACPTYTCVANYCGGCNAEYFYQGNRVSCSGPSTQTPPRDRPVFNQSYYKLELSPTTPVNYNFIRVLATGDLSRTIVYSIQNTSDFSVNVSNGWLFVTRKLTNNKVHTFTVTAAYRSSPTLTSTVNVYINITDKDSPSPSLDLRSSNARVYSDIARGGYVTTILAVSSDPALQNQVRYYMSGSDSLRIDEFTGNVYVKRLPLNDRTSVAVTARLGSKRISSSLFVNKVCHPNMPVAQCFADPCQTSRACPTYTCVANYCGGCYAEYFYKGNRVSCSGPSTETPPRDRPVFNQSYYKLELSPTTPVNYNFIRVLATGDLSRTIVYSIQNTSDFSVNVSNGWLFVTRKLTNNKVHNFTVTAAYRSSPTLTSTVNVYINVRDKGSPSPSLDLRSSNARVYSDIARGGYVTTILAVSSDPALQNQVRYYMSGSDSLRIDEFTGNVYVNKLPLNGRTSADVTATLGSKKISASLFVDKGCRPGVPTAMCAVDPCQVGPKCPEYTCLANYCGGCNAEFYYQGNRVNCHADSPKFSTQQYRINVSSDATPSLVGRVYASGSVNQTVIYSVINSTYFTVNRFTGSILITKPLGNMTEHYFAVSASYQSAPQKVSIAYVRVEVIAVLKLVFDRNVYMATVISNIGRGGYVTTLKAHASRNQQRVKYSIQASTTSMAINERTGIVFVSELPLINRTTVRVIATLGDVTASANLTIHKVCPQNETITQCLDNPCLTTTCPQMRNAICVANYCGGCFAEFYMSGARVTCPVQPTSPTPILSSYSVQISEGTAINTVVDSLYDLGIPNLPPPGPSVSFTVEDGGDNTFNVSEAGLIFLEKFLDYETKQRYDFIVNAIVSTLVSVSQMSVRVTVLVTNLNDNSPMFVGFVSPFIVPSDSTTGEAIFKFHAVDGDIQDTVSYQLISGDTTQFAVNGQSGELTLMRSISEGSYSLTVRAVDSGTPPLASAINLVIQAVSRSASYPWFPYRFRNFTVLESEPMGTLLETITAQSSEEVTYSEVDGSDPLNMFTVNPTSGNVSTSRRLDREAIPSASFVMEAKNQQNGLATYVQVFLTVGDVDDNSPVFPFQQYDIDVFRSWPIGSILFTIEAFDADSLFQMQYSIMSGNGGAVFALNGNNLVLVRSLTIVTASSFDLTIRAANGLRSSTTRLRIRVQDDS